MTAHSDPSTAWKHDGVCVVPAGSLDANTAQTPGMDRKAAINFARVGAQKIWAGTVTIHPNAKTGAHHHGHLLLLRHAYGLGATRHGIYHHQHPDNQDRHVQAPPQHGRQDNGRRVDGDTRGQPALQDAFLEYAITPLVVVQAGQYKRPFSRDFLTSSTESLTFERVLPHDRFFIGRDIGVMLHNDFADSPGFEYAVGVFNGSGDGLRFTSALPTQILKTMAPLLTPVVGGETERPCQPLASRSVSASAGWRCTRPGASSARAHARPRLNEGPR